MIDEDEKLEKEGLEEDSSEEGIFGEKEEDSQKSEISKEKESVDSSDTNNSESDKNNESQRDESSSKGSEDNEKDKDDEVRGEGKEIENSNDFSEENKELEKIQNKQIKWAVFLMVAIVLIIVVVPFIKNNFIDKFDYKGLVFQKTQIGELVFYSSKFPVVSGTGQVIGDYAVNLRNDPRDLEYIPVNVTDEKIEFTVDRGKYGEVYISLNPFMEVCEDSGIALLALSGFLRDSALDVKSAVTDKAYARKHNLTQRWCHNSAFDTVILVTDGNETAINEIKPNCYELQFNNCEILQVSEKLMLNVLEQYASRFQS